MRKWLGIAAGVAFALGAGGQAMAAAPSDQQVRQLFEVMRLGQMFDQMNAQMAGVNGSTYLRTSFNVANAASLQSLRPLIEGRLGSYAWDPIFAYFLNAPSWAVLGILGIILILFGRKRRPLIGYAR